MGMFLVRVEGVDGSWGQTGRFTASGVRNYFEGEGCADAYVYRRAKVHCFGSGLHFSPPGLTPIELSIERRSKPAGCGQALVDVDRFLFRQVFSKSVVE